MFEHYLSNHQGDPKRRLRLFLSGNAAALATVGMLAFTYAADRFDIARVDAPATDYIMFQLSSEVPMAAPPPPPPPLGSDEQQDEEQKPEPDEEVPVEVIPTAIPKPTTSKSTQFGNPKGSKDGVPGGKVGGIPGGSLTGTETIGIKMPIGLTQRRVEQAPPPEPIAAVMARCIYCPDPNQQKLSTTSNGMFGRRSGRNKTQFCLNPDGKVASVKTVEKFPGDPAVDAICRQTVKKWRIKPQRIAGRPVKTCSTVTFDFKFQ